MDSGNQQDLQQVVAQLREENAELRRQMAEPDMKAFEQLRELRASNKKLTDEFKRVTGECVQLAFKSRQTDAELKKVQNELESLRHELAQTRSKEQMLGQSVEDLQSQLSHSKDTVVSHEAELDRQKEELSRRQEQMLTLRSELEQREGRISNLEKLINEFKEQYLSGEYLAAVEPPPASTSAPESPAYQTMVRHMEAWLGVAGATIVDQVYDLSGIAKENHDSSAVESVFEALQDTAAAFVQGTEQHGELESVLGRCWEELQELRDEQLPAVPSDEPAPPTGEPGASAELPLALEQAEPTQEVQVQVEEEAAPAAEPVSVLTETAEEAPAGEPTAEFEAHEPEAAVTVSPEVDEALAVPHAELEEVAIEEPAPVEAAVEVEASHSEPAATPAATEDVALEEYLESLQEAVAHETPVQVEAQVVVEEVTLHVEEPAVEEPAAPPHVEEEVAAEEAQLHIEEPSIHHQLEEVAPLPVEEAQLHTEEVQLHVEEPAAPHPVEEDVAPQPIEETHVQEPAAPHEVEEAVAPLHIEEAPLEEEAVAPLHIEEAAHAEEVAVELNAVTEESAHEAEEAPAQDAPVQVEAAAPAVDVKPWQRKQQLIEEGLASTDASRSLDLLEDALGMDSWSGDEARAELALARLKRGRADISEHFVEALPALEIPEFYDFLPVLAEGSPAAGPLCEFLKLTADHARADVVAQEGRYSLGGRSATRELISQIGNEEEERSVEVLLDHIYAGSGLKLPLPSPTFKARRDESSPAAFVGTLRQALRLVDYTLFGFQQLDVVSYDGPDRFLVDGALEPGLTLMFSTAVEGTPAEEVRFLAFRRLVQLFRRYTTLSHLSASFDSDARIYLVRSAIDVLEAEGIEDTDALRALLEDHLSGAANIDGALVSFLREAHGMTQVDIIIDLGEWLFQNRLLNRRLNLNADRFAAKICGLGNATYGSLREELLGHPEVFAEFEAKGLRGLFTSQEPALGPARLRVQRLWTAAFHDRLGYE